MFAILTTRKSPEMCPEFYAVGSACKWTFTDIFNLICLHLGFNFLNIKSKKVVCGYYFSSRCLDILQKSTKIKKTAKKQASTSATDPSSVCTTDWLLAVSFKIIKVSRIIIYLTNSLKVHAIFRYSNNKHDYCVLHNHLRIWTPWTVN